MNKFYFGLHLFFTYLFISSNLVYCQSNNSKSFLNEGLWIKGLEKKASAVNSDKNELELNALLNFHTPVDFVNDKILKKYKNLISKKSSLFIVLRSLSKEENQLLTLDRGVFKSSLSTKKMICDKEIVLNRGGVEKGIVLSYFFNKNSLVGKKNGALTFDDQLFNCKDFKNQLLELIYLPRVVSEKERNIIESYLSVKYGISRTEGSNYYDSMGEKVWDVKESEGYNYRITGLGKDEKFGLNQKQSRNAASDGFVIGLNKIQKNNFENKVTLADHTHILWGDNGKSVLLEESNDSKRIMKRVWMLKAVAKLESKNKIQIKIDKTYMPVGKSLVRNEKDFLWLAIDTLGSKNFNYSNAIYLKASVNNENEIIFDDVAIESNKTILFTIVSGAENIITKDVDLDAAALINDYSLIDQFILYPNPILSSQKFHIQFNLLEPSNVSIQITDVNGKIIKTKNLGFIDKLTYTESVDVSGTYLIVVTINGKVQTSKLIVK